MVTFKENRAGVVELLRAETTRAMLAERAQRVAEAAHAMSVSGRSTYRVDSQIGTNRARAAIITDTPAAMMAEAMSHRLATAIDAAQ